MGGSYYPAVRRLPVSLLAAISFWLSLSVTAFSAGTVDQFDIVGIKLGMTPEEASQALQAHGVKKSAIEETRQVFSYSDGLNPQKTEGFIFSMSGGLSETVDGKRKFDSITLYFSPPPKGGRVIAIQRVIENKVNPVTRGQFREALIQKYGPAENDSASTPEWLFGTGTKACRSYSPPSEFKKGIVREVYVTSGSKIFLDRFRKPQVNALEECANQLRYQIGAPADRPAMRVTAFMADIQSWVGDEMAANEWVSGLAAEAAAKREGAGEGPAL